MFVAYEGSMVKRAKIFLGEFFNESLAFEVQTYNLLALAGMAAGALVGVSCILTGAKAISIALNFASATLTFFMLRYTRKTGRYHVCYWIIIIAVFLLELPVLYFSTGGYRGGMPCFFVFALVFTTIMLHGSGRVIALILESVSYTLCCLVEYFYPETVSHLPTDWDRMINVIVGMAVSGGLLILIFVIYTRIYRRNRQRLEELDRLKIEFLGNMSHELKTPLTCVSGFARHSYGVMTDDWPLSDRGLDEMRDNLRLIIMESDRMKRIVEELLDIATIEQGRLLLKIEQLSVRELVEEVGSIHFKIINTNGNKLTIDISHGMRDVYADRDRLRQVLLNLLSNASRHTRGGEIRITAREEEEHIKLSVSDNGEGIPHELKGKLFEHYLGADIGRAHGTGLGLYICKQIIEVHGGEISVESEPGVGTDVFFTLPFNEAGNHRQQDMQ